MSGIHFITRLKPLKIMLGYESIVMTKNQKVYILFELDPSWEVIGGA